MAKKSAAKKKVSLDQIQFELHELALGDIMFDDEFNYYRTVLPVDEKGATYRDLRGSTDGIVDGAVNEPLVRFAEEDEIEKYKELHAGDDGYDESSIPPYVCVDGFGRLNDLLEVEKKRAKGAPDMTRKVQCKVITNDELNKGQLAALVMVMNTTARVQHPFDQWKMVEDMMEYFGVAQTEAGAMLGKSPSQVTALKKVSTVLTEAERKKALDERWSFRQMLDLVAKKENKTSSSSSSSNGVKRLKAKLLEDGLLRVQEKFESIKEDTGDPAYASLYGFLSGLMWANGNFDQVTLAEVWESDALEKFGIPSTEWADDEGDEGDEEPEPEPKPKKTSKGSGKTKGGKKKAAPTAGSV
jgi:hypothetical protein